VCNLSRYTHRVAISNRRLIAVDERRVTFKVKDYRLPTVEERLKENHRPPEKREKPARNTAARY
jgi:hypothetical protein